MVYFWRLDLKSHCLERYSDDLGARTTVRGISKPS